MLARLLTALLLLAGVAFATPAFPHAALVSTTPPSGAVLSAAPSVITLSFNELVEPTAARLITASGGMTELQRPLAVGTDVAIALPPDLGEGTHILSWRVVSGDGHPIGGTVVFSIGTVTGTGENAVPSDFAVRAGIWTARLVLYLALFIGAAGTFFAAWVAAPAKLPRTPASIMRGLMSAGLVAVPFAFALQGVDLVGGTIADVVSGSALAAAFSSTYAATLVVAVVALVAGLLALGLPRFARLFSLVALLGVGLAFALSGHASKAPPEALSWLVVFIHTATVAFWTGALLPLLHYLRANARDGAAVLGRFSATIPHALMPLVVAGALLVLIQVDKPADVFTTDYGRLLAIKLALVALLLAIAVVNRFRLTPLIRTRPAEGARQLRRTIGAELVLVIVVFGVVAGWRFTPPPRSLNAAEAAIAAERAALPNFINHFHVTNFGASVIVSPAVVGLASVTVSLMTGESAPLDALELDVTLAFPDAGIEPITIDAVKQPDGFWRADGFYLAVPGNWTMTLTALISDFDRRSVSGPIVVADPNAAPAPGN